MSAYQYPGDVRAYVLIDSDPEMTDCVVESLRSRSDVRLADAINGPHNVIAVVEGGNASSVAAAILAYIRKLEGVRDITVYVASTGDQHGTSDGPTNGACDERLAVAARSNRAERRV